MYFRKDYLKYSSIPGAMFTLMRREFCFEYIYYIYYIYKS